MFPLGVVSQVAVPPSTLLNNLVAWWDLDETSGTRYDAHTNNLDLSLVGTNAIVTGVVGNAFNCNGAGYLTIADNALLDFGDSDVTIAFWYYPVGTGSYVALQKSTNSVDGFYGFFSGTTVGWYCQGGGTVTRTITTGAWNHILYQYNKTTDQTSLQVNLGTASTGTKAGGFGNNTAAFRVGANWSGANIAVGRFDVISMWTRLLTTDEKNEHYNSGAGIGYGDL